MAFKQHLNIVRTPFEFIHFASKKYTFRFANYIRTLSSAKSEMISKILVYDSSDKVNAFKVNGITIWYTPTQRSNFKNSIESAKYFKQKTVTVPFNNTFLELKVEEAEYILAKIQVYADACENVTVSHIIYVKKLETIPDVDGFKYDVDYPKMEEFFPE